MNSDSKDLKSSSSSDEHVGHHGRTGVNSSLNSHHKLLNLVLLFKGQR